MRGPIRRDCPPPPLRFFGYLTKHPVLSAMGEENCRYEQYTKIFIVQFSNPGRKTKTSSWGRDEARMGFINDEASVALSIPGGRGVYMRILSCSA